MPQLLPRFYARLQEREDLRKLGSIVLDTGCSLDEAEQKAGVRLVSRSADGHDPARLRGLPAIGRNVSGATVHTDPVKALLRKEARGRRR